MNKQIHEFQINSAITKSYNDNVILNKKNRFLYKNFNEGEFWRSVPGYGKIASEDFLSHRWQMRNTITKPEQLLNILGYKVDQEFFNDVKNGFKKAPMAFRVSPYIISLIDWSSPSSDPLRKQFITLGSMLKTNHYLSSLIKLQNIELDYSIDRLENAKKWLEDYMDDKEIVKVLNNNDLGKVKSVYNERTIAQVVVDLHSSKIWISLKREKEKGFLEYHYLSLCK